MKCIICGKRSAVETCDKCANRVPLDMEWSDVELVAESLDIMARAIGGTITHVNATPEVKDYLRQIASKGGNANSPAQQLARAKPKPGGGRPPMNPSEAHLMLIIDVLRHRIHADSEEWHAAQTVIPYLEKKAAKRAAGKGI